MPFLFFLSEWGRKPTTIKHFTSSWGTALRGPSHSNTSPKEKKEKKTNTNQPFLHWRETTLPALQCLQHCKSTHVPSSVLWHAAKKDELRSPKPVTPASAALLHSAGCSQGQICFQFEAEVYRYIPVHGQPQLQEHLSRCQRRARTVADERIIRQSTSNMPQLWADLRGCRAQDHAGVESLSLEVFWGDTRTRQSGMWLSP